MLKDIEELLKIQECDIKVYSLKLQSEILPKELDQTKQELRGAEKNTEERREDWKKQQVKYKELEGDLAAKQENVKKCDTQLFQIKTNEEYKAMQKQINDLKFNAGLIEDKILEQMEQIDTAQETLKTAEAALKEANVKLKQKEDEVVSRLKILREDIVKLEEERNILAKDIPEDFLRKYERIFRNKRGVAIVAVENKNCGGCHMALTPNVINEVKRSAQIIICDNCARILYDPGMLSRAVSGEEAQEV